MTPHTDEAMYAAATANRLRAADLLATLTPEQWRTPSLCDGWTVRELAAHLLQPIETDFTWPRLVVTVIRHRGRLDRVVDHHARREAAAPTEELVARLRAGAGARVSPPVVGPAGPMSDSFIHLRDAARPLGLDVDAPPDDWRLVLDFLVTPLAARTSFTARGRLDGIRLVATDTDWSHGDGPEVVGPAEALALAAAGRRVALTDLTGHGAEDLGLRLG